MIACERFLSFFDIPFRVPSYFLQQIVLTSILINDSSLDVQNTIL